jgi:hypothetical protein
MESHALEPDVIGEFTRHRQVARYIATVDFDDQPVKRRAVRQLTPEAID